ncbi:MAG: hypothetical protein MI892_09915 [Desulfobacterales bacterium]|nr:hypothetical protein [Desulfobacterales bacterium]
MLIEILKAIRDNAIYLYTALSCLWIVGLVLAGLSGDGSGDNAGTYADRQVSTERKSGCLEIDGIEICD